MAAPAPGAAAAPPTKQGSKTAVKQPENFWSESGYKRVVKRVEDGITCLDEFAKMVQERAELEKKHAKSLLEWSHRWDQRLEKAPSFKEGTLDNAWRALLTEAESSAAVLQELETVLRTEVKDTLMQWKKQNYPRFLGRNKVVKKVSSDFEKARKPYEKAASEENKKKQEYYGLAAKVYELEHRMAQAKQYSTPTSDKDIRQLQAELDKAKPQLAKAKQAYEEKVRARSGLTDSYRREMAAAFKNCQEIEKRRIEFFVQVLRKYQNLVAQSQNQKLAESDRALQTSIGSVNSDNDLALYSAKHGIDMPFNIDVKPEPWVPVKAVTSEESFADAGSLQGTWFLKQAERHGRAHRRFFVYDEKNMQMQYFEKLVRGVPELPKGAVKLKEIRSIELDGKIMTLATASRRWVLSPAPKDEKTPGASPNMEDWAQRLSALLGLPITRPAAPAAGVVPVAVATTVVQEHQQQPPPQQPQHQEPDSDESDHEGAALAAGAGVLGAGAVVAGALLHGGGHAAGAAGSAAGHAAGSGISLLPVGVPMAGTDTDKHGSSEADKRAPVRFVVIRRGPTIVKLSWMHSSTHATDPVIHYQLEKDGQAQPVILGDVLEHTATGLQPSTTHRFHLRAFTAKGPSSPSSLTINTLAPGAPEENMEFDASHIAYTADHHSAATRIQSVYRGNKARDFVAAHREQHEMAH